MIGGILFGVIFFAIAARSFYYWIKRRDNGYLWASLLNFTGFLAEGLYYLVNNVFHTSTEVRLVSYRLLMVVMPVIFIVSIVLLAKLAKEKEQ